MGSDTIFDSASDEKKWVIDIKNLLHKTNLDLLKGIRISIYHVPKSLSSAKPEAFLPQQIAIGPYNHVRPHLYCMERFKILSVNRLLNHFHKDLRDVVQKLRREEGGPCIRASYHMYLDFNDTTLLHIMAIDGLFLLDFLQTHLKKEHRVLLKDLPPPEAFANDEQLTKDVIARDVIMLENQIPISTMNTIFRALQSLKKGDGHSGSKKGDGDSGLEKGEGDSVGEELFHMLLSFCQKHCPFEIPIENIPEASEALTRCHLLDLLYHLVLPEKKEKQPTSGTEGQPDDTKSKAGGSHFQSHFSIDGSKIEDVNRKLQNLSKGMTNLRDALRKLPCMKSKNNPTTDGMQAVGNVANAVDTMANAVLASNLPVPFETKTPAIIINIPSVSELHKAGINFLPAERGITSIQFNEKKGIFYLPKIRLDVNSEVIMRNMVAYEALTKTESCIFTRYTELMRAIIDTVEDVQLLKKADIIRKKSTLSDKECEGLFNGMSKSIRPTKTEELDGTIGQVNNYYNHIRKVRALRLLKEYVYSSWRLFTLLATLVLLLMTALQTVCSFYNCPRIMRTDNVSS